LSTHTHTHTKLAVACSSVIYKRCTTCK